MDNTIDAAKARTALELLQLQADLLDLEDSVSRRMQAALRQPTRKEH